MSIHIWCKHRHMQSHFNAVAIKHRPHILTNYRLSAALKHQPINWYLSRCAVKYCLWTLALLAGAINNQQISLWACASYTENKCKQYNTWLLCDHHIKHELTHYHQTLPPQPPPLMSLCNTSLYHSISRKQCWRLSRMPEWLACMYASLHAMIVNNERFTLDRIV